jgi:methionine-rich copper-binding protein CopC
VRRFGLVALTIAATVVAISVSRLQYAAPASAHSRLMSAYPAQATSAPTPRAVVLTFDETVQAASSSMSVTDTDHEDHVLGTPSSSLSRTTVTQQLDHPLKPGRYQVTYRVQAADTHVITGSFTFRSVDPESGQASVTGSASAAAAASSAVTPARTQSPREPGNAGGWHLLGLLAVLAGAAAAAALTCAGGLRWRGPGRRVRTLQAAQRSGCPDEGGPSTVRRGG